MSATLTSRSLLPRYVMRGVASSAARTDMASSSSGRLARVAGMPSTAAAASRALHVSAAYRQGAPGGGAQRGKDGGEEEEEEGGGASLFSRPGPPPLPPKEQREFEKLVREKANAPQFQPASAGMGEQHPQYRAKPKPEFEGDENPSTGEVGGPKNEPLQWEREWTYGGRSTDF